MNLKSIASAIALSAAVCLPMAAMTSTAHAERAGIAVKPTVTTNFNSAATRAAKPRRASRKTASRSRSARAGRAGKGRNPSIVAKVQAHARAAGVPVSTAMSIVQQESGFRPNVTGSAGEIGLMQLKCQTARGVGFKGACSALYNPDTNLRFGMKYLRQALNRGSVAYYNAGIHARKLPRAARKYAAQVTSRF